jgi:hypothetical protein
LQCVDYVFDEMQRMALQCETPELTRFPELRERTFEIVNAMLRACLKPTQKMISSIIQVELAYINTSHPDFIGGKQAIAHITKKLSQPQQQVQQPVTHVVAHATALPHDRAAGVYPSAAPDDAPREANTSGRGIMQASSPAPNSNVNNMGHVPNSPLPPSQHQSLSQQQQQVQSQQGGGGFFSLFSKAAPTTPAPAPPSYLASGAGGKAMNSESLIKLPQVPDNVRVSSSTASTDWGR